MKTKFYNMSLVKVMAIVCLFNINAAIGQKAMNVMNSKIMQPYKEVVKSNSTNSSSPLKIGIGAETYVSGNAHGAFYCATINLLKKKSIFSLGPCLQNRSLELNGLKFGYSVSLSGSMSKDRYDEDELMEMAMQMDKDTRPEIMELRLGLYTQYTNNAKLSQSASLVETITNPESNINYYQSRFSTVEIVVCPELVFNLKNITLRTYAGFTTFYHINHMEHMYRPQFSTALVFGAGILIPKL